MLGFDIVGLVMVDVYMLVISFEFFCDVHSVGNEGVHMHCVFGLVPKYSGNP